MAETWCPGECAGQTQVAPGWRCATFTGSWGAAVDGQAALSLWQTPAPYEERGESAPSASLATVSRMVNGRFQLLTAHEETPRSS